jgi:hypothetical protein
MGEVARDAHVEVFGDPGDRDGGLVAQSLSDFDFDRIDFEDLSGGCLRSSGFRGGGFEESASALFFAFLNFVAVNEPECGYRR